MDYISHHALHSHIPVHHYTNHTAVTIHSLVLIVSPHLHLIHTHTFKQHSHMHSPQSLVLVPADISECYSSCYLLSLCLTPDCLTLELWTCACDPDFCLVLYKSLLCLRYSCCCLLTIACLILSNKSYCKWIHSPQTLCYKTSIWKRLKTLICSDSLFISGHFFSICSVVLVTSSYLFVPSFYDLTKTKQGNIFGINSWPQYYSFSRTCHSY